MKKAEKLTPKCRVLFDEKQCSIRSRHTAVGGRQKNKEQSFAAIYFSHYSKSMLISCLFNSPPNIFR
jgi:hypothetical protein